MPKYELVYFDGRGRGELARLCLAYAGQEFEDTRIVGEKWAAMKQESDLMLPYLPVLKVDGTTLQETCLIGQYIGDQHGFGGANAIEKHLVLSMAFFMESIFTKIVTQFFEKDEEKKAGLEKEFKEKFMPLALAKLEAQATKNGNSVFFGNDVTVADIHFYNVFYLLIKTVPDILTPFPGLKAIYDKVESNPKIAEWVAKRPETPY